MILPLTKRLPALCTISDVDYALRTDLASVFPATLGVTGLEWYVDEDEISAIHVHLDAPGLPTDPDEARDELSARLLAFGWSPELEGVDGFTLGPREPFFRELADGGRLLQQSGLPADWLSVDI